VESWIYINVMNEPVVGHIRLLASINYVRAYE